MSLASVGTETHAQSLLELPETIFENVELVEDLNEGVGLGTKPKVDPLPIIVKPVENIPLPEPVVIIRDPIIIDPPPIDILPIDPKDPIDLPGTTRPIVLPGTMIVVDPKAPLAGILPKLDGQGVGGALNQVGGLAQTVAGIVKGGGGLIDQLVSGGFGGGFGDGIVGRASDASGGSTSNAATNAASSANSTSAPSISTFMISGVQVMSHDGFETKSSDPFASGQTAAFDAVSYGFTTGVRTDASDIFGLAKGRVTFGVFGNYTHTDVDVGVNDALQGLGLGQSGDASINNWSAGGFTLLTAKAFYGMAVITGTFGQSDVTNLLIGSSSNFDSIGFSASAVGGWLAPVGKTAKLDLNGRLTYGFNDVDDYTDSNGTTYQNAKLDDLSITASARLFDSIPGVWAIYRPFIHAGVTQRLDHTNEIKVDGVKFDFDDADTTVFGRVGVDFEIRNSVQAYVAVRGDVSDDVEVLAGQVGVTFRLD